MNILFCVPLLSLSYITYSLMSQKRIFCTAFHLHFLRQYPVLAHAYLFTFLVSRRYYQIFNYFDVCFYVLSTRTMSSTNRNSCSVIFLNAYREAFTFLFTDFLASSRTTENGSRPNTQHCYSHIFASYSIDLIVYFYLALVVCVNGFNNCYHRRFDSSLFFIILI